MIKNREYWTGKRRGELQRMAAAEGIPDAGSLTKNDLIAVLSEGRFDFRDRSRTLCETGGTEEKVAYGLQAGQGMGEVRGVKLEQKQGRLVKVFDPMMGESLEVSVPAHMDVGESTHIAVRAPGYVPSNDPDDPD